MLGLERSGQFIAKITPQYHSSPSSAQLQFRIKYCHWYWAALRQEIQHLTRFWVPVVLMVNCLRVHSHFKMVIILWWSQIVVIPGDRVTQALYLASHQAPVSSSHTPPPWIMSWTSSHQKWEDCYSPTHEFVLWITFLPSLIQFQAVFVCRPIHHKWNGFL